MDRLAAVFPGQGSQSIGMGKALLAAFPLARLVFEEAEDAISLNIRNLCLEGPAEELEKTAHQQPSILTLSVAFFRTLEAELGLKPGIFAGHSLGEYSALVAAGKLPFNEAVKLVYARGSAMQRAVPIGEGAMAAIMGLTPEKLLEYCKKVSRDGCIVEVANYNSPSQQIISGHAQAVKSLCQLLGEIAAAEKIKIRAIPLKVSAPFHSSLMSKAREEMTPLLNNTTLIQNDHQIIANVTGELAQPYSISHLIEQIDRSVLWTKTLACAHRLGFNHFVEIGPGKVLSGLIRKTLPTVKVNDTDDIQQTIKELSTH